MQGAQVRMQGAEARASIIASLYSMKQQHATTTTTTIDQIGPAQHDAAIGAPCVRARFDTSAYSSRWHVGIVHSTISQWKMLESTLNLTHRQRRHVAV